MVANNREDLLNLIPAYAIGALDDDERAEVETWLEHDPEAQAVLADYQKIAGQLVMLAPPRSAPAHLQVDLRRRLAASRGRDSGSPGAKPDWRIRRWLAAAAVLVVAGFLGVLLVRPGPNEETESPAARLYAQLRSRSDSSRFEVVAGEVSEAVWGNMVVSSDGAQAVLCVWDLPPLAGDQIFQVWLTDNHGIRTNGGLFTADVHEDKIFVQVPFDQPIAAYQSIGVSLEPAGGSPYSDRPSGPRVLSVPLGES